MSEVVWVMDTEVCESCDELLDYFGQCPNGCDLLEWEEEEEIDPTLYDLDFDEDGRYIGG